MRARRHGQSGFSMLELLAVMALIAILATVALPSFFGESRKTRGISEVQWVFADLRTAIEQYAMMNGAYPASLGEGTLHPTAPAPGGQALEPLPASWLTAKVRLSNTGVSVFCSYTWVTGPAGNGGPIGTEGGAFGFTAPGTGWYYLLAKCDLDNDDTIDSFYFASSVDPTVLKRNEGY